MYVPEYLIFCLFLIRLTVCLLLIWPKFILIIIFSEIKYVLTGMLGKFFSMFSINLYNNIIRFTQQKYLNFFKTCWVRNTSVHYLDMNSNTSNSFERSIRLHRGWLITSFLIKKQEQKKNTPILINLLPTAWISLTCRKTKKFQKVQFQVICV